MQYSRFQTGYYNRMQSYVTNAGNFAVRVAATLITEIILPVIIKLSGQEQMHPEDRFRLEFTLSELNKVVKAMFAR